MSLRRVSSSSPLAQNMDPFHASYGLSHGSNNSDDYSKSKNKNNAPVSLKSLYFNGNSDNGHSEDANDENHDDEHDYDGDKTGVGRPSQSSGLLNNITGVLPNLPGSLSPARSFDNTTQNGTSQASQQQPQQLRQFTASRSSASSRRAGQRNPSESSLPPPFVMQVTAVASLGGVLFGYDMGVIAGALPQLTSTFSLTESQQELVVSILYLGGGLGAALGGTLCDVLGRKPAILWTDVLFMVGASVLFTASHVASVCVGRVIVGFAVAVSGIADVSYLHEIAPTQWRGAIVSVNEACISLGFLLAFIVGTVLTPETTGDVDIADDDGSSLSAPPRGWRYMFGIGGVLALIQFVGMWTMPESPTWLRGQGRHEESVAALRRIHGRDEVPVEECAGNDHIAEETVEEIDEETEDIASRQVHRKSPIRSPRDTASASKASYESLSPNPIMTIGPESNGLRGISTIQHLIRISMFRCHGGCNNLIRILSKYRRQVWIALFLSTAQQFCGQTSVLNYAPTILQAVIKQDSASNGDNSGSDAVSGWATLSIGIVKFIATVLVIWKIEIIGRRRLLFFGMGIIAFGLLLVAVAFSANSPYLQEKQEAEGTVVQSGSGFYFALPGVLLVVSGYSMSFGPLTWLLTSELFPADIRGRALGASTIVTYLCAALVTYSFLTAQSLLGTSVVFLIYMFITLAAMVFAFLAVPDTGGKNVEEIDIELSKMPWWRRFSRSASDEPKQWQRQSSSFSNGDGGTILSTPQGLFPSSNGTGRLVEAVLT